MLYVAPQVHLVVEGRHESCDFKIDSGKERDLFAPRPELAAEFQKKLDSRPASFRRSRPETKAVEEDSLDDRLMERS